MLDVNKWCHNAWQALEKNPRPDWLVQQQQLALNAFKAAGLPTRKLENWRYTQLITQLNKPYALAEPVTFTPQKPTLDCHHIVMVNGQFIADVSCYDHLEQGVIITSLKNAFDNHKSLVQSHLKLQPMNGHQPFYTLNSALFHDGVLIYIPKNCELKKPIYLHFVTKGDGHVMAHPRYLLIQEANSKAMIIEHYQSSDEIMNNAVAQLVLGENAHLQHIKCQQESKTAIHFANSEVTQQASSCYEFHQIDFGGKLKRDDRYIVHHEQNSTCRLKGLYLAEQNQQQEHHLTLHHAQPQCVSDILYKGLAKDEAKTVFNGQIYVAEGADGTFATMTNNNLLLSHKAQMNSKPELEIYTDDVRCSHGATVGQLDDNALFYMQSRGIKLATAKNLLILGFVNEITASIKSSAWRDWLVSFIHEHLQNGDEL